MFCQTLWKIVEKGLQKIFDNKTKKGNKAKTFECFL